VGSMRGALHAILRAGGLPSMTMKLVLLFATAVAFLAVAFAARAQTPNDRSLGDFPALSPLPGSVYVQRLTGDGTGCPAGTTAASVADDLSAFTVMFSNYLAEAGGTPGMSSL